MPSTDVFFEEWNARRPDDRRSLSRATRFLRELGVGVPPLVGVVGSKGKGTTATVASAHLAAAGLGVVTVTGPSFRSHRERVRFNGEALDEAGMAAIAARIREARGRLPAPEDGYLSPNSLFLSGGLLEAERRGADVCVFEAGVGGHRDELRLLQPRVVAMASVFAEHTRVLGATVPEIGREKAGVAGAATEAFVRLAQLPEVAAEVDRTVAEVTSGRVRPETVPVEGARPELADLLPAGLSAASGALGVEAATRMLRLLGRPEADLARQREVLSSLWLPARLSHHRLPGADLIVDSAINGTGVRAALEYATRHWQGAGGVEHVLLCLPDHKDLDGAIAELGALPVTAATLPEEHLRFEREVPAHWNRVRAEDLTVADITALGKRVLVMGTVYFTGRVLDTIGADTDRLFTA